MNPDDFDREQGKSNSIWSQGEFFELTTTEIFMSKHIKITLDLLTLIQKPSRWPIQRSLSTVSIQFLKYLRANLMSFQEMVQKAAQAFKEESRGHQWQITKPFKPDKFYSRFREPLWHTQRWIEKTSTVCYLEFIKRTLRGGPLEWGIG